MNQERTEQFALTPIETPKPFFEAVTLKDLYGTYTLKPGTQITTDVPYSEFSKFGWDSEEIKALSRELLQRYDIPHIGCYSSEWKHGQDENGKWGNTIKNPRLVISAAMGAPSTLWAPHVFERGAVLALAHSLSREEKPFILDVGCGTGLTAKLLAVDGEAKVVGIDPSLSKYKQIQDTPGNVNLVEASAIDGFDEFAPERKPDTAHRISEIISQVHDSFKDKAHLYFSAMNHGFQLHHADFSREIRELQGLARKNEKSSQVDVAICSFMSTGTDLTLAIRDGIRPKAIVYILPMNGLAGVGNYYFGRSSRDSSVSFNPGRDYRTVARWQTFWKDDWGRVCYDQGLGIEPAEVIVQLRHDVHPKPPRDVPTVRTYLFDEEIVDAIRTGIRWPKFRTDYYQGVMEKMTLLKPKRELPYRRIAAG